MRYLLDTNILSELGKPVPNAGVLTSLDTQKTHSAVSAVTWHEFQYGILRMPIGQKRTRLEKLAAQFAHLPVIPYDEDVAYRHALAKVNLERIGKPMPGADGQIAAIAEAHGLTLVTRNVADFQNYPGLKIENWFTP